MQTVLLKLYECKTEFESEEHRRVSLHRGGGFRHGQAFVVVEIDGHPVFGFQRYSPGLRGITL